jgi:hypothetical protein
MSRTYKDRVFDKFNHDDWKRFPTRHRNRAVWVLQNLNYYRYKPPGWFTRMVLTKPERVGIRSKLQALDHQHLEDFDGEVRTHVNAKWLWS